MCARLSRLRALWPAAACCAGAAQALPSADRSRRQPHVAALVLPGRGPVRAEALSQVGGRAAEPKPMQRLLPPCPGPPPRSGEPLLARQEVARHDGTGADGSIWVTYRDGVYDVTGYMKDHPGGKSFLLQAAGGPVDGFWDYWGRHHASPAALKALGALRIGRLEGSQVDSQEAQQQRVSLFEEAELDAVRAAKRRSTCTILDAPFWCNIPSARQLELLTPNSAFFVRSHGPVPMMQPEEAEGHTIEFCFGDKEPAVLSLAELKQNFKAVHLATVLQCGANRAEESVRIHGKHLPVYPAQCGGGCAGNAVWGGVRLFDVLQQLFPALPLAPDAGEEAASLRRSLHVCFEGSDGFHTSAPLDLMLSDARGRDCLLATEMNFEPLPADHGFPVRALVPGLNGARSVKWLTRVAIGPEESESPWNRYYYTTHGGAALQVLPMNSLILSPESGQMVEGRTVPVRGVAYSGGNSSGIASVEVSADKGKTWQACRCRFDLLEELQRTSPAGAEAAPTTAAWCSPGWSWVPFEAEVRLPLVATRGCGQPLMELWCRARCQDGEEQPEVSDDRNAFFFNGYHKVALVRGSH